jgi:hypothetical protein
MTYSNDVNVLSKSQQHAVISTELLKRSLLCFYRRWWETKPLPSGSWTKRCTQVRLETFFRPHPFHFPGSGSAAVLSGSRSHFNKKERFFGT